MENSFVRKYLAERAELIGAIRLINTAFRDNAGTDVATDIILLQKFEYMENSFESLIWEWGYLA